MTEKSIRTLHARIGTSLKWISTIFLAATLVFVMLFMLMSGIDRKSALAVWRNLFLERLAEIELVADGKDSHFSDHIVHELSIAPNGTITRSPDRSLNGMRLNASGFYGKIHELTPGNISIIFYPDLIDGIQRIHFIKRNSIEFIVLSIEPEDFFPVSLSGYAQLSVMTDGIIWFSEDPGKIGNIYRRLPLSIRSGRLYASVEDAIPSIPMSKLVITMDITQRGLILYVTTTAMLCAFWFFSLPIRRIKRDFMALQREHESVSGLIKEFSTVFHGKDEALPVTMMNLAPALRSILEGRGKQEYEFEENRQYQNLISELGDAVCHLVETLSVEKQRLVDSEERFRTFTEQSPLALCILHGATLRYVNPKFLEMFGLDKDVRLETIEVQTLFAPDYREDHRERIRRRMQGLPTPAELDAVALRRDGTEFPIHMAAAVITLPEGPAIIAVINDITEQQRAANQIKTSLAEKEVLLRELYHRTRNNMNVIVAMLSLQADYQGEENLKAAFKEAQSRIQAMSLVHQKLYDSRDLSRISLTEYINDLLKLLLMNRLGAQDRIKIETRMDEVFVLIDTAIPCGLVLSEIISNSVKHAFPAGRAGTIRVDLSCAPDGTIRLGVADDGVGLPAGFDPRSDGRMGLNFIYLIGEGQLQASINARVDQGVAFELLFKDDLYTARV